ncbi:hypothetical protein GCM10007898_25890 [Dyella flagellata]|uniref:Uncharacterized protein n=1 Tax=Dyella flagellata TaxID=1867833 RepID=A0ABQ5XC42_9GAMM|nr:hypothetical protein GCM10007898_25890 [Dyella flagellata]
MADPQAPLPPETGKQAKHLPRIFRMAPKERDCDTRSFTLGEGSNGVYVALAFRRAPSGARSRPCQID